MAKLSAHGIELARFENLRARIAYFADGHILRNSGDGWKLWRKIKPGFTSESAIESRKKLIEEHKTTRPCFSEFRKRMIEEFPSLESRTKALLALEMIGNDIDGCWSEMEIMGIATDLKTVAELCRLEEAARKENKEISDKKAEGKE